MTRAMCSCVSPGHGTSSGLDSGLRRSDVMPAEAGIQDYLVNSGATRSRTSTVSKKAVEMDARLIPISQALRHRFEAFYGERLVQMRLFGSQARGDATSGSDIDVLIVLQGPVNPGDEITRTSELTASLSLQHNVVISRVFVSNEPFTDEQSPLLLNVRREGIPV